MKHIGARKLGIVLPALAPGLAIVALAVFAGRARVPAQADAAITPADAQADYASLNVKSRLRSSQDAMKRADARANAIEQGTTPFASPFFSLPKEAAPQPAAEAVELPPDFDAHLTSLMDTPRGAIAVIDGRPCRVGDRLADRATITSIDVAGRTVSAKLDSGESIQIRLTLPGVPSSR